MVALDERRFAAMGTSCRVVLVGGSDELAERARRRVLELEGRWSRFLADSELSTLNAARGCPCVVSPDTFRLVANLVTGWQVSGGRFDPTLHDSLLSLGYDRDWRLGATPGAAAPPDAGRAVPPPGCGEVVLHGDTNLVWMPTGVRLDPGGLGKGLAADMVVEELTEAGVRGAMMDLGGDLRVTGDSPDSRTWRIDVEHPGEPGSAIARVETRDGAVATTSSRRRRWPASDGTEVHHVLDSRTALPASPDWSSATALARTAVEAEVGATVAFLDGCLDAAPRTIGALLAGSDGTVSVVGDHPELFGLAALR